MDDSVIKSISGTVVTLDDGKDVELNAIFDISDVNISKEFMQQASVYAYFSAKLAAAEHKLGMIGLKKDQIFAAADDEYRRELDTANKKYTEAVIRGMIATDDQCIKISNKEQFAKYDVALLKSICRALEMRANMLISLGSQLRHELDQTGLIARESSYKKTVDDVKSAIKNRR